MFPDCWTAWPWIRRLMARAVAGSSKCDASVVFDAALISSAGSSNGTLTSHLRATAINRDAMRRLSNPSTSAFAASHGSHSP